MPGPSEGFGIHSKNLGGAWLTFPIASRSLDGSLGETMYEESSRHPLDLAPLLQGCTSGTRSGRREGGGVQEGVF